MRFAKFDNLSGSSKLFLDFINFNEPAARLFRYDFRQLSSYKTIADAIDVSAYDRSALVSLLRKGLQPIGVSPQVESNIKKLGEPDSLAVFAGQQVGMLLGPMFTIIKALTAYKMAARLERELGRPVVPCFWMATDDHDFAEVKTIKLLDRAGNCVSRDYDPDARPEATPMSDIILDDKIAEFLADIGNNLVETEFKKETIDLLTDSYRRGRSLPESFASLFNSLLGEFGIIPVDPNFPGMKKLMIPVFRREIENHEEIYRLFETRSREIIAAGYHRQVHKTEGNLNLFLNAGGRRNIMFKNGRYGPDGGRGSYSEEEMLALLEKGIEKFSPNVVLRPIAQCAAFPTICQIVGPSEAAYFAQTPPIFDYMKIPLPVVRPRMFTTVMEPHINKTFQKLSLDFVSLYNDPEHEAKRAIMANFPPKIQNNVESLRPAVEKPLRELADSVKTSEPEGFQALEHALTRIDQELNHLSKKLLTIHKKRHETANGQIDKASKYLFPEGKFQ